MDFLGVIEVYFRVHHFKFPSTGRVQHERLGVWIPAVPGRHGRRRRIWWWRGRRRSLISIFTNQCIERFYNGFNGCKLCIVFDFATLVFKSPEKWFLFIFDLAYWTLHMLHVTCWNKFTVKSTFATLKLNEKKSEASLISEWLVGPLPRTKQKMESHIVPSTHKPLQDELAPDVFVSKVANKFKTKWVWTENHTINGGEI